MDRRDFLQGGCCGCAALTLLPAAATGADAPNDAAERLQRQLDAVQARAAWLAEAMDETLDEAASTRLLERVGRRCAREYAGSLIEKHRGDVDGLLKELEERWTERPEFDRQRGLIRIGSKHAGACACPLVKRPLFTARSLCNCSAAFFSEIFSEVTGRPAASRVESSVLRGGGRCRYAIQLS
jgi:predicted ArsR family transcriptional regulator